jgi:hypothetical protein
MANLTRNKAPKMFSAADFVLAHPGCTKLAVAESVGPNASRRYGYAIVNRAIRRGLIKAVVGPRGRYSLTTKEEA